MAESAIEHARQLIEQGNLALKRGDFLNARDCFQLSHSYCPSADALTYWGWMEHKLGNVDLAIELCKQAIGVDPNFGNPYNDIGSYLIAKGMYDEAIPWLEKAKCAPRYEPKQYPHLNMARIYIAKGMPISALEEFRKALKYVPYDAELKRSILLLETSIN